jgi:hypothetical protein
VRITGRINIFKVRKSLIIILIWFSNLTYSVIDTNAYLLITLVLTNCLEKSRF